MIIRRAESNDSDEWLRMRTALWPDCSEGKHRTEMADILADETGLSVFAAAEPSGSLCGFVEVSLRQSAEGCGTRPVGYIEGWFVDPDYRNQGVGRSLVVAAETWALEKGCQEMASDCLIDNGVSLAVHLVLGYEEVERLIHFRKTLNK